MNQTRSLYNFWPCSRKRLLLWTIHTQMGMAVFQQNHVHKRQQTRFSQNYNLPTLGLDKTMNLQVVLCCVFIPVWVLGRMRKAVSIILSRINRHTNLICQLRSIMIQPQLTTWEVIEHILKPHLYKAQPALEGNVGKIWQNQMLGSFQAYEDSDMS